MNILILTCGTGGGHNAAARAVEEAALRRGHAVTLMNPYSLCPDGTEESIDKAYIELVQKAPGLFGAAYALGNTYRRLPFRSPLYFANRRVADIMARYLAEHPADAVIMTHLFPAQIFTYLKYHDRPVPKMLFIATDYTCIPFTEECRPDACVIPAESLRDEFMGRGIPGEILAPSGIPVNGAFTAAGTLTGEARQAARREARRRLGLDSRREILIAGGSMGAGHLVTLVRRLNERITPADCHMTVICGSNEALRDELDTVDAPMTLLGRTDNMADYLQACDLYMTKPGGLSTTEAAVARVPLALLPPIPGCETRNRAFFADNGLAVRVDITDEGLDDALSLMADPDAQEAMAARQAALIRPDAAERICRLAEELCGA